TLARISNSSLYGNEYSVTDVMKDLTTNIFAADLGGNVNLIRQNLQADYVQALIGILEAKAGYDHASKAAALATLNDLKAQLADATGADAQTAAHRQSLRF